MAEVMSGLGSSLDFDLEDQYPQSRLSAYDSGAIAAAVRGIAPPSATAPAPQDSPCGILPPPRALGSLDRPRMPHLDEPMDESIAFIKQIKQEPVVKQEAANTASDPVIIDDDEENEPATKPTEDTAKEGPSE